MQLWVLVVSAVAIPNDAIGCSTAMDCSLNGECDAGVCQCDVPWHGVSCGLLEVLPVNKMAQPGASIYGWGTVLLSPMRQAIATNEISAMQTQTCRVGAELWFPLSMGRTISL